VLVLDGEAIGDSTRIIEVLERRHPVPPLYPVDPRERRRALDMEDFFDEELGPHVRLLMLHHVLPDAGLTLGTFASDLKGPRRLLARVTFPRLRPRLTSSFGIDDRSVSGAREKIRAAGERFQAEVGPSGYLVGDAFTVADLTLAAMLAPVVAPEQFPYPQPQRGHPRLAPLRDLLAGMGLIDWTRQIYTRHRSRSAELAAEEGT
jgi:glutathione S-transferase